MLTSWRTRSSSLLSLSSFFAQVEGIKNIKVVDCDKDQKQCQRQQIRALPTWKIKIPSAEGKVVAIPKYLPIHELTKILKQVQ